MNCENQFLCWRFLHYMKTHQHYWLRALADPDLRLLVICMLMRFSCDAKYNRDELSFRFLLIQWYELFLLMRIFFESFNSVITHRKNRSYSIMEAFLQWQNFRLITKQQSVLWKTASTTCQFWRITSWFLEFSSNFFHFTSMIMIS